MQHRPATRSDILAFYDRIPGQSVRAWVWERDGELMAVAGYHLLAGQALVFSDIKGDLPKMTIWREARKFMQRMGHLPMVCQSTETSGPFLERLGWRKVGEGVYAWQL